MQKHILILGLCLLLVAIAGYILPEQDEPVTKRILLENVGGGVVFDHEVHVDSYGLDCVDCHHELEILSEADDTEIFSPNQVLECGVCHGVDFGEGDEKVRETFAANHVGDFPDPYACVTCHHLEYETIDWGHDMHVEDFGLDCLSCHHDTDIEDLPQNCANCHDAETSYTSLKDAVHMRCVDCHFDKWEIGIEGCADCHIPVETLEIYADEGFYMPSAPYATCQTCHEAIPTSELIPARMEAFHTLCMDCHEMMGGPYTQEQCKQCHTQ